MYTTPIDIERAMKNDLCFVFISPINLYPFYDGKGRVSLYFIQGYS